MASLHIRGTVRGYAQRATKVAVRSLKTANGTSVLPVAATLALILQLIYPAFSGLPVAKAADTGFKSPGADAQNGWWDGWTNPDAAYVDGGSAASDNEGERHRYYDFNFGVPAGSIIEGIEVLADAWSSGGAGGSLGWSDGFGTGSSQNNISSWEEEGDDDDSPTRAQQSGGGEDVASPEGGRFARIADNEWICRSADTSGGSATLSYYWSGDAQSESNDFGIVEYRTTGNCNSDGGWSNLASYALNTTSWSTLQTVPVPSDDSLYIRFRTNASQSDEHFRVDGVGVTVTPPPTTCQLGVDLSWNGGGNWTTEKKQTLTSNEQTHAFGGAADTWGRSWTSGNFSSSDFRARVHDVDPGSGCANSATSYVDWLRVNVYYSEPPATITIVKQINNGGGVTITDFTFKVIDSQEVETIVQHNQPHQFPAGNYVVREEGPTGYSASFGGACDGDGNLLNVQPGQSYTCYITNTYPSEPPEPQDEPELHFIKALCPSYPDVAGNANGEDFDDTAGQYVNFSNYSVSEPHFPSPYGAKPISPAEISQNCVRQAGWEFKLSTDEPQTQNDTVVGPTDGTGEYTVAISALSTPLKNALNSGNKLWVSEVEREIADFAAIRCYQDAKNGDNLEFVEFNGQPPLDTYCIAYNVGELPEETLPALELTKDGAYDSGTNQVTFNLHWSLTGTGQADLTLTDPVPVGTTFVSASDGGTESAGVVTWNLGTKAAPDSGSVSFIVSVDSTEEWADSVESSSQGTRKDGSVVLLDRSDPTKALGIAESTGAASDSPVLPGTFYSLGFTQGADGGVVTLGFSNMIVNGAGNDLKVFEVTGGTYPDELVRVEVSQNGTTWVPVTPATVTRDGEVDIDPLPWAKYVRLTDVSDKSLFAADADGYDLDAVKALHSAPGQCKVTNQAELNGTIPVELTQLQLATSGPVEVTLNEFACEPQPEPDPTGDLTICKYYDNGTLGMYEQDTDTPLQWSFTVQYPNQDVLQTGTNEQSGCVTIAGLLYGDYQVTEDSQDGWTRSSPSDSSSQTVTLDSESETVYFLNYQASQCTPGPVAILNGGFEEPVVDTTEKWDIYPSGTSGLGWTVGWAGAYGGAPQTANLELHRNLWTPAEDSQYAEMDTDWDGPGVGANNDQASVVIYQHLDVIPYATYQLSFKLSARPGYDGTQNKVRTQFGSIDQTNSLDGTGNSDTEWFNFSYPVTNDSGTSLSLQFTDLGTPDSFGMFIDDVRLARTCHQEEPTGPVCGNGTVEGGEQCDDGNTTDGDGCSSQCQTEGGGGEPESPQICGYKYEVDEQGTQEGVVAQWPMSLWTASEAITFQVDANDEDGVTPDFTFASGVMYKIEVTDTANAGDGIEFDAKYSERNQSGSWTDDVQNYEQYGPELLDLQINGSSPDWGEYNEAHTYFVVRPGDDASWNFKVNDIDYPSNEGSLTVHVYALTSTGQSTQTDENGHYCFTDLTPGHYVVQEGSMTDYEPYGPIYCQVVLNGDSGDGQCDFSNHYIGDNGNGEEGGGGTSPVSLTSGGGGGGGSSYQLIISNEQMQVAGEGTSVTITWTTNHQATSRIVYDTVSHPVLGSPTMYGYAFTNVEDATLVTSHSMVISGLIPGVAYYFRPVSHGSPETTGVELAYVPGGSGTPGVAGATDQGPAGQVLGATDDDLPRTGGMPQGAMLLTWLAPLFRRRRIKKQ